MPRFLTILVALFNIGIMSCSLQVADAPGSGSETINTYTISAFVMDSQSKPVPGKTVRLQEDIFDASDNLLQQTITGENGSFAFDSVRHGAYTITIAGTHDRSALIRFSTDTLLDSFVIMPGILVEPAGGIAGMVRNSSGVAMPGINVHIRGYFETVTTGPDGSFSLTLPSGTYAVAFSDPALPSLRAYVDAVQISSGETVRLDSVVMYDISQGCIAYWPLDSIGGDSLTPETTGLAPLMRIDGPQLSLEGVRGKALRFINRLDHAITVDSMLLPAQGTLSFWIKACQPTGTFGRKLFSASSSFELTLDRSGSTRPLLGCKIGSTTDDYFRSKTRLVSHRWYHVACTWDSEVQEVKLFLDGAFEGSGIGALDLPSTVKVILGTHGGSSELNGYIDEVRMYNRVLAPHEIASLVSP